jgi:hypothetical protein
MRAVSSNPPYRPSVEHLPSSLLIRVPPTAQWKEKSLPQDRSGVWYPSDWAWTYGRYLEAIEKVIAKDSFVLVVRAAQRKTAAPLSLSDISSIHIYAEKHGNWYHPAKIVLKTRDGEICFVMNVALHERGRAAMVEEVRALRELDRKYGYLWVPKVYAFRQTADFPSSGKGKKGVAMFLADWFEGYHEFHLSYDRHDGKQKLVLWDGCPNPQYLSPDQTGQIYRSISRILALYYNPATYEQIFPWHHGAGDFVVKISGEAVDVRLVTVRQYGALADPSAMEPGESLLFFFLNLSIRIRLDRLDGTGEMAWAEEDCLPMAWKGFLEGLESQEKRGILSPGSLKAFLNGWRRISEGALIERFLALYQSYDPQAPDLKVIAQGLPYHIISIYNLIKGGG